MILRIGDWASSYDEGKIFREGITCAIVGKTNVGKSSLLNVLAKEERAIVTPIPGTTRDLIEEVLNISGIPVRLVDTAGLRNASDLIEKEGVRRTKEKVADSDLVLLMLDGSRSLDSDDIEILEETKEKKKILVLNKNDLPIRICIEEMVNRFRDEPIISISALKNEGIDSLKKSIYNSLIHREIRSSPDFLIVANLRHKTALAGARDNLVNAKKGLEEGSSPEFIAFEIRSALDALGEIVGETTSEDVLNLIFEQFCIGK
jgi:tRNA modification GTPase